MSATVTNLSKQAVTLILDHPAFFNKQAGWQRTTAQFTRSDENGVFSTHEVRRSYPASLTLFPGESAGDLHEAIINCTQVPALIARKILSVKITKENEA